MTNKNEIISQGAQGELTFLRVAEIPGGCVQLSGDEARILGHSETGHHHVLRDAGGVAVFAEPGNPFACFLRFETVERADIDHLKGGPDMHGALGLLGGVGAVWQVTRGREYTPEGERVVQD